MKRNRIQDHPHHSPDVSMQSYNGLVTASSHRSAPQTDVDHTPRLFRRIVDASGFQDVQLQSGVFRRKYTGVRLNDANYLYAAVPVIPGQRRNSYGGFVPRGIDPLSYANLVANGPGAQPANPGGPGQMTGNAFYNPYAMGGG